MLSSADHSSKRLAWMVVVALEVQIDTHMVYFDRYDEGAIGAL